jgi:phage terminase large subunit-like protein
MAAPIDWNAVEVDPVGVLATLPEEEQGRIMRQLSLPQRREFKERWHAWAHGGQCPDDGDWRVWMILAGRGYGKTRAGSEWVSALARADGSLRFALVGATIEDVRKVMIEGESGLIAVAQTREVVRWNIGKGEIVFASGATAHVYSAESHEKLRGPEHSHAWCDEIGKWHNAEGCWDNLMLGLRLGDKPRVLVTTTPRSVQLIRRLVKQAGVQQGGVQLRGGKTAENYNLPDNFVATVRALYGGTRLGRQELDGELIEDIEGALWSRDMLEGCRVVEAPALRRIVIGVDPPITSGGDDCGIVVVGRGVDDRAYVLADHSVSGRSPEGWARAVAAAAELWDADRVVAEGNQGGEMVESTLRAADLAMPIKRVHARVGKVARAEPVAALYEAGRASHVGAFPALEDQLCGLITGGGYEGPGRSPDRADALVWAMSEVMLGRGGSVPGVRIL